MYLGGPEGGELLVQGAPPGAMSLTDLRNRVWHLLREPGPDTGYPVPTTGDFNVTVVTRDLNIALAQFISESGLPPSLTDRMDTFPVFAGMDYPVPPGLVALTKIEYTPAGGYTYALDGCSMTEFDDKTGYIVPPTIGQPLIYRQPFAGYIRLYPQPGPGQAVAPGVGQIVLSGTPTVGEAISATFIYGAFNITTASYTVLNTDTLATVATALVGLINASAAVTGANAFMSAAASNGATIYLTALNAPGTTIQYSAAITGPATMTVSPTSLTNFVANGDYMTWYYSSLGVVLSNVGDTPAIPPQFHMAPVYRVLMDYWRRKSDLSQAKEYERMYEVNVMRAKALTFDANRASQPTISGADDEGPAWPFGIG